MLYHFPPWLSPGLVLSLSRLSTLAQQRLHIQFLLELAVPLVSAVTVVLLELIINDWLGIISPE